MEKENFEELAQAVTAVESIYENEEFEQQEKADREADDWLLNILLK